MFKYLLKFSSLKENKAIFLINKLNHMILTCDFKQSRCLTIQMNKIDLELIKTTFGIDEDKLTLYDIPVIIKSITYPILVLDLSRNNA